MAKRQVSGMALILTLLLVGCFGSSGNMKLPKAFGVKGNVQVDGQPAGGVIVRFEWLSGEVKVYRIEVTTQDNGDFELKALGGGDGLPNGVYGMTFSWPPPRQKNSNPEMDADGRPVDKLNHKYEDGSKSEHKITVDGKSVDVGKISLTTTESGT